MAAPGPPPWGTPDGVAHPARPPPPCPSQQSLKVAQEILSIFGDLKISKVGGGELSLLESMVWSQVHPADCVDHSGMYSGVLRIQTKVGYSPPLPLLQFQALCCLRVGEKGGGGEWCVQVREWVIVCLLSVPWARW